MLGRTPTYVNDCLTRAADCRERSEDAVDSETRTFWQEQELRWLKLAASNDLSSRFSTFVDERHAAARPQRAEGGVQGLIDIFDCACRALELDLSDDELPRRMARALIGAALDGERDEEQLFLIAVKAASN